jgi:hypothetical protein
MTISTTILSAYDVCKRASDPEFCRQQAIEQAPKAVDLFLKSYDTCLQITSPENCKKMMAYDVPTPPLVPFIIGLGLGFILKK